MALIKSISGIRGTIGGHPFHNLTPIDVVLFTSAFAEWLKLECFQKESLTVVVGRDARISGEIIHSLVVSTLVSTGINVVDIGIATTPTTEMAVIAEKAQGGIVITASHNPKHWNALKLLNSKGEFISEDAGRQILNISQQEQFCYAPIEKLGNVIKKNFLDYHIGEILKLQLVKKDLIEKQKYKVVVDGINSVGAIAVPELLRALGIEDVVLINEELTGDFKHNPEPLDEHLSEIKHKVVELKANLGIVVDPDVDRLVFVCEDGELFGEEYTLVAVADYVLQNTKNGVAVSNLSSSRALKDITDKYGAKYYQSAVGEVNVVQLMKETNATIGGEGNGGVIYPELHYGRDALVGIALFLSYLSQKNIKISELKKLYPQYKMIKHKINIKKNTDFNKIKEALLKEFSANSYNDKDGIRIDFDNSWIHCRPSNTEPIIRLYIEAPNQDEATKLFEKVENIIQSLYEK